MKIILKKEPLRIDYYGKLITVQPYVYGYDFTHFERICGYGGYRDYCVPVDRIKKIKIDGKWVNHPSITKGACEWLSETKRLTRPLVQVAATKAIRTFRHSSSRCHFWMRQVRCRMTKLLLQVEEELNPL